MKTKIIILISFIYSLAAFGFEAAAVQNPPVVGIGIVIKKNPGGGSSKVVSGKDGSFSIELTKGSYLVSLNQDQLMKVGQELVKTYSPKSKYQFNGDGTQMLITENENIIMSQLEGNIAEDLMLITVTQNTTLQGNLLWDNSVVEQPQGKSANYKGHVTLIRRSAATQNLQVFCPTGTIGMDGKCVPIKELENLPIAQTANYVGHVTLLKKNAQSIAVASTDRTDGEPIPGIVVKGGSNGTKSMVTQTNTSDYVGHVTLLRFSQLYVGGGLQMPSSTTKEGANSVNGIDFNIGYYHPIWAWEKSMISLGLNAELGYNLGNGERDTKNQYTVYNLAGQSQLPTVSERGTGSPRSQGFRGAAGLQMNVHLGDKFTLSPIINAGYLSTTHKSFSVTETVYYNGSAYNYDLLSQKESKTSSLGILPKLRMTYNITPRIGIWLEGNYTMGPKIKTETTRFVLDPSIPSDSYNLGHFAEGQYITTKKETSYSAVGVNGGIVFSLGKPKNPKKPKPTEKPTTQVENNNPTKDNDCIEYSAPVIISPKQNENIYVNNGELFIDYKKSNALFVNYRVTIYKAKKGKKELIHDKTYPHNFSGKIEGLKSLKDENENLTIQMQAIAATQKEYPGINARQAAYQKSSCATFVNNGNSNVVNITASSNRCTPDYEMNITKAECMEGKEGKIKVEGNYKISYPQNMRSGSTSLTISNIRVEVDGQIISIYNPTNNINTVSPILVTSGQLNYFSFEIEGANYCKKNLKIKYDLTSIINCSDNDVPSYSTMPLRDCQDSYDNLPCCLCNYCENEENIKIEVEQNSSGTVAGTNNVNISQQMTITPKLTTRVSAEIIAFEEEEIDDACKTCRKNKGELAENEVYHFIPINKLQWGNNGIDKIATPANGSGNYPSKIIEWFTNNNGSVVFDLTIAIPGTASLDCCERHGKIGIRYTFTDEDCRTCEKIVWYNY